MTFGVGCQCTPQKIGCKGGKRECNENCDVKERVK